MSEVREYFNHKSIILVKVNEELISYLEKKLYFCSGPLRFIISEVAAMQQMFSPV